MKVSTVHPWVAKDAGRKKAVTGEGEGGEGSVEGRHAQEEVHQKGEGGQEQSSKGQHESQFFRTAFCRLMDHTQAPHCLRPISSAVSSCECFSMGIKSL